MIILFENIQSSEGKYFETDIKNSVESTVFPHHTTWISPDRKITRDHVFIGSIYFMSNFLGKIIIELCSNCES
jgi:hypothetical protein